MLCSDVEKMLKKKKSYSTTFFMIFKMNQDRLYNYTMIFIFLTLLLPILSYYLAFFFFFLVDDSI